MKKKVGIIGSGISGIASAYVLDKHYDVTLVEANTRLGGHTHTVQIEDPQHGNLGIDTGFIVFNLKNYPLFSKFLDQLKIPYQDSDMSFGFWDKAKGFWYSSDVPKGLFSNKKNIVSITFWRFLYEMTVFNKRVLVDLEKNVISNLSLEAYLNTLNVSRFFKEAYILPMGAAIWSCPVNQMLQFPAKSFFMFWKNHCLLTVGNRPVWKTVSGGSQRYIDGFLNQFKGVVYKGVPVVNIRVEEQKVYVTLEDRRELFFDAVVVATHADQALSLLDNPSKQQRDYLGAWRYTKNRVYLHTDKAIMPPKRSAWASWMVNHSKEKGSPLTMTYYMNRLQGLKTETDYFVTLNSDASIREENIIKSIEYTHPVYDKLSLASQETLSALNVPPIFFCGSYFGYGFHEDGIRSAIAVCQQLGVQW